MKKYLGYILILLVLYPVIFAQSAEKVKELETQLTDIKGTERVYALLQLTLYFQSRNPGNAIKYGREALEMLAEFPSVEVESKLLNALATAHIIRNNYDTATRYIEKAQYLFEQTKDKSGVAETLENLAHIQRLQNNYSLSFHYLSQALKIYEEAGEKSGLANVYQAMGRNYFRINDYTQALEFYLKAATIYRDLGLKGKLPEVYNNIASIYGELNDISNALDYLRRAMEICEETDDLYQMARSLHNNAYILMVRGQYDRALVTSRNSLAMSRDIGDRRGLIVSMALLAIIHKEQKQFPQAREFLEQAMLLAKQINDREYISGILMEQGRLNRKTGNYSAAVSLLEQSMAMSHSIKAWDEKRDAAKILADTYRDMKKYKKALELYNLYDEINNRIYNQKNSTRIAEMQARHESEKQENENRLLKIEQEKKETTLWLYRIMMALAVLLIVVFFVAYSKKKTTNKLLRQQKQEIHEQAQKLELMNEKLRELDSFKKDMTGMIVHDLKNYLNTIIYYSEDYFEDAKEIINMSGRQMLNEVSNILDVYKFEEAEMPLDVESHELLLTVADVLRQVQFLTETKNLRVLNNIPAQLTVMMDPRIMQRVFTNLMTNAIKHTPSNGQITLEAVVPSGETSSSEPGAAGQQITVSVTDSGDGIPEDKLSIIFDKYKQVEARQLGLSGSSGLGLTFCRLAILAHGGQIGVNSKPGKGSSFWFTLKKG